MVIVSWQRRSDTVCHRGRRLSTMSIRTGPDVGRLLPMPCLMPHSLRISIAVTLIFPVIGMIADKRRHGRVHPAWWWTVGAIIVAQVADDIIAYSPWGVRVTEALIAGTPGADRPLASIMPPDFYGGPAAPLGGSALQTSAVHR